MAHTGRIYQRGDIYYVAYRWDGREYRESARSSDRAVAERLLAQRVRERAGRGPTGAVTFDTLATWYLDDYTLRGLRTLDTAHGRVANLRAVFGGWGAARITTAAIGGYQRTRRAAGAAGATVNRETSALSRMFHLGVRAGRVPHRPIFPDRLEENGPRQGFFEHGGYAAVRRALPGPYQDVLDFAYYSGWRKREILDLRWDEVDEGGGVVRLSPSRSKTRVGHVLPISAPIAAVLSRRRARRRSGDARVFTRDETTVRAWRRAWPTACRSRRGSLPRSALARLPSDGGAESGPRRGAGTGGDGPDGALACPRYHPSTCSSAPSDARCDVHGLGLGEPVPAPRRSLRWETTRPPGFPGKPTRTHAWLLIYG